MPGSLAIGDLERIAEATDGDAQDLDWLADHFSASDGVRIAQLKKDENGQAFVALIAIPTIVPALVAPADDPEDARCVFLDDAGRCTIHAVSPYGCSHHDTHFDEHEGDERTRAMISEIADELRGDPLAAEGLTYHERWVALANAGCIAPPLAERRENFAREFYAASEEP